MGLSRRMFTKESKIAALRQLVGGVSSAELEEVAVFLIPRRSLEQTRSGGVKFKIPKGKKRRVVTLRLFLKETLEAHKIEQRGKNRTPFGQDYTV